MRREWKPYNDYLDKFFNARFIEQKKAITKHAFDIAKHHRMINRIKNAKISYPNDDYILKDLAKKLQYSQERRSVVNAKQKRLIKYIMSAPDINLLTLVMNKLIVNEVLRGHKYTFPYRMGTLHLKYIEPTTSFLILDWKKSLDNHLRLTKEFAPVLHARFKQKLITRREYYKAAADYVAPKQPTRIWMHFKPGGDWLYPRYKPNYAYHKKLGNYYRFKYTAYNALANPEVRILKDASSETTLQYLDTEEKIFNNWHLGSITKCVLLQLQNPDYKYKFTDNDLQINRRD